MSGQSISALITTLGEPVEMLAYPIEWLADFRSRINLYKRFGFIQLPFGATFYRVAHIS
ncbi:MAG TPA: hypothetical protein V6C99_10515 [Oculatellaceae cyanobacterium]|jgi:hypothetical protein